MGDESQKMDVWSSATVLGELIGCGVLAPMGMSSGVAHLEIDPSIPNDWRRMVVVRRAAEHKGSDLQQTSKNHWDDLLDHVRKIFLERVKRREKDGIALPPLVDVERLSGSLDLLKYAMRLDPRVRPSAADVVTRLST